LICVRFACKRQLPRPAGGTRTARHLRRYRSDRQRHPYPGGRHLEVRARDPEGRAWTGIDLGDIGAGTHFIQILLEDGGGATHYLNPSITATVVPVPPALTLFGSDCWG